VFPWLADVLSQLRPAGFRLAVPVRGRGGEWITQDGWAAWTAMDGRSAGPGNTVPCAASVDAFHDAVARIEVPPEVRENRSVFGLADHMAWNDPPAVFDDRLRDALTRLYELRRPILNIDAQLIHGDPNPGNFLIEARRAPAIIDIAPLVRPPLYSTAMLALWFGPRLQPRQNWTRLRAGTEWAQCLVRAAIRMLLIVQLSDGAERMTTELPVARAVIELLTSG
jgi:hypothetical protein